MRHTLALLVLLAACGDVTTGGNDNAPTIASLTPDRGGMPGGATVTLTGSGFVDGDAGENHVIVGTESATAVDAVDDGTLTFALPPGPAEGAAVDVLVFNSNGFAIARDAITYNAIPLVTAVSERVSRRSGGGTMTITGRGFQDNGAGAPTVTFGEAAVTEVDVVSDTEITATIPAKPDGVPPAVALDVTVSNANGSGTLPKVFHYLAPGFLATTARRNVRSLVYIDPDTFVGSDLGLLSAPLSGAVLAADETLYSFGASNGGFRTLGTLDPFTGKVTSIGGNESMCDLAMIGDVLYGYTRGDQLVTINRATGVTTVVGGGLGLQNSRGALTARDASSLYAVDVLNQPIRIVNAGTGAVTSGPTIMGNGNHIAQGALLVGGDLLVLAHDRNNPTRLFRIAVDTGAIEELGAYPYLLSGLAKTPASFE